MKNIIYLFLVASLAFACETDDSSNSAYSNIISADGDTPFEDLLILVNVQLSDSSYLVVSSIDSLSIYINNNYWACVNSTEVDTSLVDKQLIEDKYVSDSKLNYFFTASQDVEEPNFTTAGDYAAYMNSLYELDAGEYACFIESYSVKFNDGTTKTYYPLEYKLFKVEEDLASAYVGEFEFTIE